MSAYVTKPTSACERVSRALSVLLSELHFPTRALGPITEARDLLLRAALDANEFYATERDELVRDVVKLRADLAAAVARADLAERDRDILGVRVQDLKDSIADMQHLMDDGASLNVKLINERDRLRSMYVESTERLCGERDTLRARLAAIEAAPTVQSVFVSPFRQVELIERPAKDQP